MRPLSIAEIDQVLESIDICVGRPLQTVVASPQDVVLGFWERRTLWLWLDLQPAVPALLPMLELPFSPPAGRTPLQLFLKAHFAGKTLKGVERDSEKGRVVLFHFDGGAEIEFRMIPRAANCIARFDGKQISLRPVQELAVSEAPATTGTVRELRDLLEEWKQSRVGSKTPKSPRGAVEKKLESARRSIDKVASEIENKEQSPWRKLGEWLVANQSLDVPDEFKALVDQRRKLAWNIEQCFHKAKEADRKLEGTRARLRELKASVSELENRLAKGNWVIDAAPKTPKAERTNARTLHVSENLQVVVGKSARDNLDLLRKARAWDIWLHVKDRPSAHAILFRPKGAKVTDDVMRKAAQWLVKMSLGSKYKEHMGEKFQILNAECRFVSPIKGDRIGRVTYRNEKVFGIQFDPG